MKHLFDKVSARASKITTTTYSTSFSLGIYCLSKRFHEPIYNIYGFVRFADEIVDTFHQYNKAELFEEFKQDTWKAIERGISLNPILNSFQKVVNDYQIERELIEGFLRSMETDLYKSDHSTESYNAYIYGSAEVVGLMCLRVFAENNTRLYDALKPAAMKLGAAFQKVNFLRDLSADFNALERTYFPGLNPHAFTHAEKTFIERDIEADFDAALVGIKKLPRSSRFGVYVAYIYYRSLYQKIQQTAPSKILNERIRVSNYEKIQLLITSYFKHTFRMI